MTGTIKSFAPADASPVTITFTRMTIGFVLIYLLCLYQHKMPKSLTQVNWPSMFGFAAGLLGFQLFFFGSVSEVGVAVGSVVSIGATPIWTAILEKILYGKNPKNYWYPATLCAVIGVILLNIDNVGKGVNWLYIIFPLLASLSYAIELIFADRAVQGIEPEAAMVFVMAIIAIVCLPFMFFVSNEWVFSSTGIGVCLAMGILTAAIPFPIFFSGLKLTTPTMGSMMGMAEPMTACLLGIVFLHETFNLNIGLGIALILMSIVIMIRGASVVGK